MVSNDDTDDGTARLEAALERIALLAQDRTAHSTAVAMPETRVLAERLDSLIAHVRKALGPSAA